MKIKFENNVDVEKLLNIFVEDENNVSRSELINLLATCSSVLESGLKILKSDDDRREILCGISDRVMEDK